MRIFSLYELIFKVKLILDNILNCYIIKLRNISMRYLLVFIMAFILLFFQDVAVFNRPETQTEIPADENSCGDNECTILVISGSATVDGRPIVWKNRDVTRADQKYLFIPKKYTQIDTTFAFNGNFYADDSSRCYMGVNEKGFAIINANCYNLTDILKDGIDDGDLMRLALEQCEDVEDWETLLNQTNLIGRRDAWIFGVMDASGAAKLYECSNFYYYSYDANDPEDAPDGILIRTVFALAGWNTSRGAERHKRARELIEQRDEFCLIDVKYILQTIARDFYCSLGDPYPLPFNGQIDNLPVGFVVVDEATINRWKTRSGSVIRGILPGEDPRLMTTFAVLGQPVLSIAIPLWVASYTVPDFLSEGESAPWFEVIDERMDSLYPVKGNATWMNTHVLLDNDGSGVFTYSLDCEEWGINQANQWVDTWFGQPVDSVAVGNVQNQIAQHIWFQFLQGRDQLTGITGYDNNKPKNFILSNYPNPFNLSTTIRFGSNSGLNVNSVSVDIYNILGERVARLGEIELTDGWGSVDWGGRNDSGSDISAGVYFYRVEAGGLYYTGKMMYLK